MDVKRIGRLDQGRGSSGYEMLRRFDSIGGLYTIVRKLQSVAEFLWEMTVYPKRVLISGNDETG